MLKTENNTKFAEVIKTLTWRNERFAINLKNWAHNFTITESNNIIIEFNKNAVKNMTITLQDIDDLMFAVRATIGYNYTLHLPAELFQRVTKAELLKELKALEERLL
jgi:hypothetical protein